MSKFSHIAKLIFVIGLLISMQFVISCSTAGYKTLASSAENHIKEPHIFVRDFKKAVYKTSINIYGNNLTGLTLIKKTDSAMRVVSMSELGIKYFDFEFPDDQQLEFKVHYVMEPLNKDFIISKISKEFRLMFSLPNFERSSVMMSKKNTSQLLFKSKNEIYFFDQTGAITEISKLRWPIAPKPIIRLSDYKQSFPQSINIDYSNVSFELDVVN